MKVYSGTLRRFLDKWPGKKYFGIYRFLPIFFVMGAALEFTMINWHVGQVNFSETLRLNKKSHHLHRSDRMTATVMASELGTLYILIYGLALIAAYHIKVFFTELTHPGLLTCMYVLQKMLLQPDAILIDRTFKHRQVQQLAHEIIQEDN